MWPYPNQKRLTSHRSFLKYVDPLTLDSSQAKWKLWRKSMSLPDPSIVLAECLPPEHLPWPTWRSLNRLRTEVSRSKENMSACTVYAVKPKRCPTSLHALRAQTRPQGRTWWLPPTKKWPRSALLKYNYTAWNVLPLLWRFTAFKYVLVNVLENYNSN